MSENRSLYSLLIARNSLLLYLLVPHYSLLLFGTLGAMKRTDLVNWLNTYLEIDEYKDPSMNGLQVEGTGEVTKIAGGGG